MIPGLPVVGWASPKIAGRCCIAPFVFANNILDGIGNTPLSQQEYNNLTGETRFLRAFAYSWLVRNWGAVPFFDEQNMNDFNKPRTPEADIWKFVIDEADYAASNLPEVAKAAGRPSRYAALALKTEACLYAGRYEEAAEAAGLIISSNDILWLRLAKRMISSTFTVIQLMPLLKKFSI